jgi:hypothetical protein
MTHWAGDGRGCFDVCERRWRSDVVEVMSPSAFRRKSEAVRFVGARVRGVSAAVSELPRLLLSFIGSLAGRDKRCCATGEMCPSVRSGGRAGPVSKPDAQRTPAGGGRRPVLRLPQTSTVPIITVDSMAIGPSGGGVEDVIPSSHIRPRSG